MKLEQRIEGGIARVTRRVRVSLPCLPCTKGLFVFWVRLCNFLKRCPLFRPAATHRTDCQLSISLRLCDRAVQHELKANMCLTALSRRDYPEIL